MWNERRNRAYALYVQSGKNYTLEEVGQLLGISIQALKQWSASEGWRDKRAEYHDFLKKRAAMSEKLTMKMLTVASESKDPNDIYKMALGLIGREKIEMIRQKVIDEFKFQKPQVDENFYKDLAGTLHEKLLKRFAEDSEKYNALRLIESDIMEELKAHG